MIIIFCPGSNATGGTELLHQLGYKLNMFGFDAYMYYYGEDSGLPLVHPHFVRYHVPIVESVSDSNENIFIYPEIMISSLEEIKGQLTHSKHVLWWLSVDNANMTPELESTISKDADLIHFAQSFYAINYIKTKLKVPDNRLFYLSDYLNAAFLNMNCDDEDYRDDIVLFNPRKGYERTSKLIEHSDHRIKWQALSGLAPEDIPYALQKAKVYIDFGNHPGKDRFPREAVSCGVRILTGRKGAAANEKDVPIPSELKVSDETEDETILNMIYSLIADYDKTEGLYDSYRNTIKEEFHEFETDLLRAFSEISDRPIEGVEWDEVSLRDKIVELVTKEAYKKAFLLLAVFRIKKYPMDDDMVILEGYTRNGLGEHQEALYLMNGLLQVNDKNYEAYLIKARALLALNQKGVKEVLDKCIAYSAGTKDEEYVCQVVKMLKEKEKSNGM